MYYCRSCHWFAWLFKNMECSIWQKKQWKFWLFIFFPNFPQNCVGVSVSQETKKTVADNVDVLHYILYTKDLNVIIFCHYARSIQLWNEIILHSSKSTFLVQNFILDVAHFEGFYKYSGFTFTDCESSNISFYIMIHLDIQPIYVYLCTFVNWYLELFNLHICPPILGNCSYLFLLQERLDFSCAMFGPDGGLVANAPHIPVHLGAMQETVQFQVKLLNIFKFGLRM